MAKPNVYLNEILKIARRIEQRISEPKHLLTEMKRNKFVGNDPQLHQSN